MPKSNSASKEIGLKEIPGNVLPNVGTQLIYCEHMIGMSIGPFVSKIVIGLDNSPNAPMPQFTLVMPTNGLHLMATNVLAALSSDDNQKKLGEGFKSYQESVRS